MKRNNSSANRLAPIDGLFIVIKLYFLDLVTSLMIKNGDLPTNHLIVRASTICQVLSIGSDITGNNTIKFNEISFGRTFIWIKNSIDLFHFSLHNDERKVQKIE